MQQQENKALRLKNADVLIEENGGKTGSGLGSSFNSNTDNYKSNSYGNQEIFVLGESNYAKSNSGNVINYDNRQAWLYFDEKSYIRGNALKEGEDPYFKNKFNQAASDSLPSNREIPDTRGQA